MKLSGAEVRSVHGIGIGGIGMSGLAELLLAEGCRVSGSDEKESFITHKLAAAGATIFCGHRFANIRPDLDLVVKSTAIAPNNPEIIAAQQAGIPIVSRGKMLADMIAPKKVIAVTGMHGKTTTTTFCHGLLSGAGLAPGVMVGGWLASLDGNASWGQGDYFVTEADESDGSHLHLSPHIGVITNVDREHLNYYDGLNDIISSFRRFLEKIEPGGLAVLNYDDEHLRAMAKSFRGRVVTFGAQPGADVRLLSYQQRADRADAVITLPDGGPVEFRLPLAGRYNAFNMMAAIAVARELEIPLTMMQATLSQPVAIRRRFETFNLAQDILVVDDYAHHPSEVAALLQSAKDGYARRLIAVFQPHRFSRTEALFDDFSRAFESADILCLLDIYAASEQNISGISSASLASAIQARSKTTVQYCPDSAGLYAFLLDLVKPGDMVMFIGAGSITGIRAEFLKIWPG
jgi:UDP-N-acetylmuramate--alanine ligase